MSDFEFNLHRRTALAVLGMGAAMSIAPGALAAQTSNKRSELEGAVEALRIAMVEGNSQALSRLLHDHLKYLHSSGHGQTKASLMADLADKNFFAALTYSEQVVDIVDNTGVVAMTVDQVKNLPAGKTRASRIKVLQIWVKSGAAWQLLARSSAIVSSPLNPPCALQPTPAAPPVSDNSLQPNI